MEPQPKQRRRFRNRWQVWLLLTITISVIVVDISRPSRAPLTPPWREVSLEFRVVDALAWHHDGDQLLVGSGSPFAGFSLRDGENYDRITWVNRATIVPEAHTIAELTATFTPSPTPTPTATATPGASPIPLPWYTPPAPQRIRMPMTAAVLNSTSNNIAVAMQGLFIWNLNNQMVINSFDRDWQVLTADWNPDGTLVAFVSNRVPNRVQIVDIATGEMVDSFTSTIGTISLLDWSPDGQHIAHVGYESEEMVIYLWDVDSRQITQVLRPHQRLIPAMAWTPDGRYLASGGGGEYWDSNNFAVHVWDITQGTLRHELVGHKHLITDLAWHPNGDMLLASSSRNDDTILIWDLDSGRLVQQYNMVNPTRLAWHPSGDLLAVGSGLDSSLSIFCPGAE